MMRWIVGSSIHFRLLVVVVAAVMMYVGVTQFRDIPVDVVPEFTRPYVEIQTEALGLSAEEVEAMITTPMEADLLSGTPWVEQIRSESMNGLSSIRLYFEPGTDVLDARQVTQEHLSQIYALPSVSKAPTMLQPVSSVSRCMTVGLSSTQMSLIQMSVLARWTIKPRLMGLPGVANVSIWGQRERQMQVQVDPKKLRDKGVTLDQIIRTTGNALWVSPLTYLDASTPGTGGFIDTPNQRLGIQHIFPISSAEQLAEVPVEGTKLRLGDVATVMEDHQPLIGDALVDDAPALLLVIEKFPWVSTADVTRQVDKALADLSPGLGGLEMDSHLFRPATFIETAMHNLTSSLLIGGALVAFALLALLNSWRSGLIGIVAIVMSLVTAGLVLYVSGAGVNMLVLAGLVAALGVIIDDAVATTQNIVRRLRQHRARSGTDESIVWIVREATIEMQGVLMYAMLIILLTISPVLFMQGVAGAFFQPLTYAYALALICSLLVALTVTPVLSYLLWREAPLPAVGSALAGALQRGYEATLGKLAHNSGAAFAAAAIIVILALVALPAVRQESLLPNFKEMDLVISLDGKPGTSHPAMSRVAKQVSRELRAVPGVKNVSAQIGRAITSDAVDEVNSSQIWLNIDPAADHDATIAEVRRIMAGYPGFDCDVETYLDEQVTDEIAGEDRGLVVRVYGEDLGVLRDKAEGIRQLLAKVDGVENPVVEYPEEAVRIEIEPVLEKCKTHGVAPGEVRRAASALLSGIVVGNLFEEQKVFEVVVWGTPEIRDSVNTVRGLLIESPLSESVRLEDVANVRIASGPTVIDREAVARFIDVVANIHGRDLAAIGRDVNQRLSQVSFPLEYRAEMLGETAERLAAQHRMLAIAVAALIGIYLLYQSAFGSWRLAALMVLMLPLALVGGLIAVYATGGIMSFGSILGFFAVLAIAVRNGVLLVSRYQALSHDASSGEVQPELEQFRAQYAKEIPLNDGGKYRGEISSDLVLQGTRERLLPIVVTAIASALAFAPFVYFGAVPGQEIIYPMAVVILGGLVTATLVNLFLLPAFYLWLKPQPQQDVVVDLNAAQVHVRETAEAVLHRH
jgi:Cu/Ag efflux pump CusA